MKTIPFLSPGDTVRNTYRVEKFLGAGAFSQVYLASHRYLGLQALKVFTSSSMGISFEEALTEARTLVDLSHPNIVRIYDANSDSLNGIPFAFMTMEWSSAGTLQDYLKSGNTLSLEESIKAGIDICSGLIHTHNMVPPLLHLDIKPANLLVAKKNPGIDVKLADYGLATHLNPITRLVKSGGTLAFGPPEMAWGTLDERADVYSLGVTLYKAICGIHPFPVLEKRMVSSSEEFRLLLAKGRKDIQPPSRMLLKKVPLLDQVLLKSLAYDPFERYRTALELKVDLQSLIDDHPS